MMNHVLPVSDPPLAGDNNLDGTLSSLFSLLTLSNKTLVGIQVSTPTLESSTVCRFSATGRRWRVCSMAVFFRSGDEVSPEFSWRVLLVKALMAQIRSDLRRCGVVVSALVPSPWRLGVGGAFYFTQTGLLRCFPSWRAWVLLRPAVSFEALRRRVWSLRICGAWSCLRFGVDFPVLCSGLAFHIMALFCGFISSRRAHLGESLWVLRSAWSFVVVRESPESNTLSVAARWIDVRPSQYWSLSLRASVVCLPSFYCRYPFHKTRWPQLNRSLFGDGIDPEVSGMKLSGFVLPSMRVIVS
ncbi:hypothetical protein F2Q68_00037727 [Brassica cretica]|uniref:Uncharacterized protein n=1 Tax=Brassica cretica TaxID=69181 RepID=A0A8S9H4U6_BRACR|nr:hypothetical protein F2Q68_00037727 [Brassica cretica]